MLVKNRDTIYLHFEIPLLALFSSCHNAPRSWPWYFKRWIDDWMDQNFVKRTI